MRVAALGLVASVTLSSCSMLGVDLPHHSGLPVETIRVDTASGQKAFTVEIASDAASQERGLMYRKDLPPDSGMLFDFHQEARVSFWMKNTPLPLDMVFIKADGTVSSVEPNAVPYSTESISAAEPVQAVLEINGGRAHALGIKPGDKVRSVIFHDLN